jgi:hypothetical protein
LCLIDAASSPKRTTLSEVTLDALIVAKFTLEQATKTQRGCRDIALLFL